jgi:ribonuclease Z
LESDKALAKKTKHSTAKEAAEIARLAEVENLVLGHFSARYKDISAFRKEAEEIFNTVELAFDGKRIELD